MSNSSLGGFIRQHRRAAGLTQRQLATAAQVSIGVVRDLEQGLTSSLRPHSSLRLASALGVDLDQFNADLGRLGGTSTRVARREARIQGRLGGTFGAPRHAPLQLRILGPLMAARDGVNIALGPARQRIVLGLLATSPNYVVSRSRLAGALWGDTQPRNAATMIQSYVSALRRILDPEHQAQARDGLVVSIGSGYRLNTRDSELDLDDFHALLADARAAREAGDVSLCYKAYSEALELWRGGPLNDVESLSHHPAVISLARLRDRAVIEYAEAGEMLGWYDGTLRQLELLIEREPFHERAFACYMIALAGSGQHAAALQAFERIRQRLSNDLGLPPGPELREAHSRVLQQQVPAASSAFRVNGRLPLYQLPASVADFTGRAKDAAVLTRLLGRDRASAGGRIIVLTGMPGSGKTALALQAAHALKANFPHGQLWTHLTDGNGRARDAGEVLEELLRALGSDASAIPESVEEMASLYRARLAAMRVLVVADDACSASQIQPLLPGSGESAILVTSRSEMAAPAGSHFLQLGELSTAEAVELLRRIIGAARVSAEGRACSELVLACGRLPLAIRIIGMRLAARKSWQISAILGRLTQAQRRLDELSFGDMSVRTSFGMIYRDLDELAQRTFRYLGSLPAAEFGETVITAAVGQRDASDATVALTDRSFLASVGLDGYGNPRYKLHPLVRDYAAELHEALDGDAPSAAMHTRASGRDISRAQLRPSDRTEDHGIHRVRHQPMLHAGPVDRRPEQPVPAQPVVSRKVGMNRRQLGKLVTDLAGYGEHAEPGDGAD
jgi:DNA-binding SARP family transcriptional activator/transcriptional regulator with XRE-family HTH domain